MDVATVTLTLSPYTYPLHVCYAKDIIVKSWKCSVDMKDPTKCGQKTWCHLSGEMPNGQIAGNDANVGALE